MKIIFIRESFLKAASLAGQVINPRPNLPALGNFLLKADSGQLEITATNLETSIVYKIPVKVVEKGTTTVPARTLIDFCQALNTKQVELTDQKETLLITSERAKASLNTISPSEFPKVNKFENHEPVALKKEAILESIAQVSLSAAPEEGRPILTGVLIKTEKNKMMLVATDGYRLSKKEIRVNGTFSAIIPARALREAAKAIAEQEDDSVEMSVNRDKNQAMLQTRNLTLITRLLEGNFPDYEQIIPDSFVCEVTINTKELIDAIKLTALFAKDVGNVVRMDIKTGGVDVSASTSQVGEAQTRLIPKKTTGNLKAVFNSRFLLDPLGTIKEKETTIQFSGPTSAALMKGQGDESLVHIVMPVRPQS